MPVTTRGWRISALIYRTLVAAQTLGWAISSLVRVLIRHQRSSLSPHPSGIPFAAGSVVGIAVGIVIYYVRRSQSLDRDVVIVAWPWLQVGGLLALGGYAYTGAVVCFAVGIISVAIQHVFSPNRFQ